MEEIRYCRVDGKIVPLVISDDEAALSKAKAQGRAVLGIMRDDSFLPVPYVVERIEDIDEQFAERVVRRALGVPWRIAETERLLIREFQEEDWEALEFLKNDVFADKEYFKTYIKSQYSFFEYGLWAVIEKQTKTLIGKVGVWDSEENQALELGYHIFVPYRNKGYAKEACRAVLAWCREEESTRDRMVYAKIQDSNQISLQLAESLQIPIWKVE